MTQVVFQALWSHWVRHPMQLITLALGLALATALWSGVQAINAEARKSYARSAETLGQNQLDRLTGPAITFDEFRHLRQAGWLVSPVIEGRLPGTGVRLLGVDPLSAPPQAGLSALADGTVELGQFLQPAGVLLAAPETAQELSDAESEVIIAPDLAPGTALTDVQNAARLLNRQTLSYLLIASQQPAGLAPLDALTTLTRITPDDQTDLAQLTGSFHLNLTAFGLLSFGVGLFIVQSAIGLAFEQRRTTFRTLRALGVSLRRLLLLLGLELVSIAIVAGLIGLVLGYFIAAALLPGVAGTLRGLYGAQISGSLSFDPVWAITGLLMTLGGAAVAGAQAMYRTAHVPLLSSAKPRAWTRMSIAELRLQGLVALVLLLGAFGFAQFGNSLLSGFACLACLLLGAALALPGFLIGLISLLERFARGPLSEWLFADARQQVPALSLALMALLLALAANIGVSTMVGSFRLTFEGWLNQRLVSELYISTETPAQAEALQAYLQREADSVLPQWSVEDQAAGQPVAIYGVVDHATYRDHWPLIAQDPEAWDKVAAGDGVLINEQLARRADLWPGSTVTLNTLGAIAVVGVYSDYGNPAGQIIASFDALRATSPDKPVLRYAVRVAPERVDALMNDLQTEFDLSERNMINQADVKAMSMGIFEQTFRVTGALNILTFCVAGFAMLTSLLTLSNMRLPQLAPLWALGQQSKTLAQMELVRTAGLAVMTWIFSIPVGLILAWVLLTVVNVQAFGWLLPMSLFPAEWFRLGGFAVLAAVLAAAWPVIRLIRLPNAALLRSFASDR